MQKEPRVDREKDSEEVAVAFVRRAELEGRGCSGARGQGPGRRGASRQRGAAKALRWACSGEATRLGQSEQGRDLGVSQSDQQARWQRADEAELSSEPWGAREGLRRGASEQRQMPLAR